MVNAVYAVCSGPTQLRRGLKRGQNSSGGFGPSSWTGGQTSREVPRGPDVLAPPAGYGQRLAKDYGHGKPELSKYPRPKYLIMNSIRRPKLNFAPRALLRPSNSLDIFESRAERPELTGPFTTFTTSSGYNRFPRGNRHHCSDRCDFQTRVRLVGLEISIVLSFFVVAVTLASSPKVAAPIN